MRSSTLISLCFALVSFLGAPGATVARADAFNEGIEYKPLTPAEREDLRQYAETSKIRLTEALKLGRGKGHGAESRIYLKAMTGVIIASYQQKQRQELLMRMALNQALELTYGLPVESHPAQRTPGILAGAMGTESVKTAILRQSIELALHFALEDEKALNAGTFAELPYLAFSYEHVILARRWAASLKPSSQYSFLRVALRQWLAVVTHSGQAHRDKIAPSILRVETEIYKAAPSSDEDLKRAMRGLRRAIHLLQREMAEVTTAKVRRAPNLTIWHNAGAIPRCTPPQGGHPKFSDLTVCVTSTGVIFERIKDPKSGEGGWKDTRSGIIWFDEVYFSARHRMTYRNAKRFCGFKDGSYVQRLPRLEETSTGDHHGIRQVLGFRDAGMIVEAYENGQDGPYARLFNSRNGEIVADDSEKMDFYVDARCVSDGEMK